MVIGAKIANRPGRREFAQRVLGADVDHAGVVGLLAEVHDPGVLPELLAHLEHHPSGGAADGADREAAEQEHRGRADDRADQHVRRDDLEVREPDVALCLAAAVTIASV